MNSKRAVVDWMLADWSTLVSFRGTSSEREREREEKVERRSEQQCRAQ
jgi:hypothetical protein